MSTILDALRKVEREAAQRPQEPSSLSDTPLARVLSEKRNRRVFRRLVVVITLLFIAGMAATITLSHRLFSPKDDVSVPKVAAVLTKGKETSSPAVAAGQNEEAPKPANAVRKSDPNPERQINKEVTIPLPPRDETVLPVTAKAFPKHNAEPEKLTNKEEPIIPPSRIEAAPTARDKGSQKPSPQIPVRPSSPIEPKRSETIIRELELQAIVWSEDPGNCSTMINGSLVRLGGQIGGFTVEEIGRDYVYVKSGLRSGKLRMIGAR